MLGSEPVDNGVALQHRMTLNIQVRNSGMNDADTLRDMPAWNDWYRRRDVTGNVT